MNYILLFKIWNSFCKWWWNKDSQLKKNEKQFLTTIIRFKLRDSGDISETEKKSEMKHDNLREKENKRIWLFD